MEYGWLSELPAFVQTEPRIIRQTLEDFLQDHNISQIRAWDTSIPLIQHEGRYTLLEEDRAQKFTIILEYELPRQGGRRPDVIILENGVVAVIEFKGKESASESDIDQVAAYARDLKNYHSECHELSVVPILVLTRSKAEKSEISGVTVIAPASLGKVLVELCRKNIGPQIYPETWTRGEYAPLPSLIQAAYLLFHNLPLPRIRKADSAKIPETVEKIIQIAQSASETKSRHLVLLTGVPGSGKTLVGMQIAHEPKLNNLRVETQGRKIGAPAVLLSGNGPLVEVLQDALKNSTFVQAMKRYIEYYAITRPSAIPLEHVIIFDEAQRAWDEKLVNEKHHIIASEPSLLISIADRIPEWSVILGLVGEGQEIYSGEEAGIAQWAEAVSKTGGSNWTVHCPSHLSNFFTSKNIPCTTEPLLNLSVSLRSHLAEDLHQWVEMILSDPKNSLSELQDLAKRIIQAGYPLYITTDLEIAKTYARKRYTNSDDRFGLLASRYAKNLESIGIDNVLHFERAKKLPVSRWFNAPSNDPLSCCSLSRPATEFECQGLELDFSIVAWGDDFVFDGEKSHSIMNVRKKVNDPHQIRKNAYRVLMTRGRDGLCIFVPVNVFKNMERTFSILKDAGMKELNDVNHDN